jgi:cysteine-S-conjugate beta-lyase
MHYDFDHTPDRRESECSKWNAYGEEVLPLPVADMDFVSPQPVQEALQRRVAHGVFGYPEELDACKSPLLTSLQDLIVERMHRLYNWTVYPEELVLFPGVVPGLNIACHALAGAGDGVLIQPPVYPPFLHLAENAGAVDQQAPLVRNASGSYEIDWDIFAGRMNDQTKAFALCNPHNPVGRVFRRDELERMATVCLERGVTIVSDEIHCDLLYAGQRHIPLAALDPEAARNTITLMAPSKTFNLAGLFFSFAIIQNMELRRRFERAKEGLTGGVNILGLVAGEAAYRDGQEWLDQLLVYLEANRDYLFDYVKRELPGVRMALPEGTYLAWLDCRESAAYPADSRRTPYHFFLDRAKVALQDGKWFGQGGEGFVRLNFGCSRGVLREALARMKAALSAA